MQTTNKTKSLIYAGLHSIDYKCEEVKSYIGVLEEEFDSELKEKQQEVDELKSLLEDSNDKKSSDTNSSEKSRYTTTEVFDIFNDKIPKKYSGIRSVSDFNKILIEEGIIKESVKRKRKYDIQEKYADKGYTHNRKGFYTVEAWTPKGKDLLIDILYRYIVRPYVP